MCQTILHQFYNFPLIHMWICISTHVLQSKTRARQKVLDLINPGERFVYQGLSLFENSTSVKDLQGFAPHTLGRCFWSYDTGEWILKKHLVRRSKVISNHCHCLFFPSGPLMSLLGCHRVSKWVSLPPITSTLISVLYTASLSFQSLT